MSDIPRTFGDNIKENAMKTFVELRLTLRNRDENVLASIPS